MGKCVFNATWLRHNDYRNWIAKTRDKHKAYCKYCNKDIELGKMGEGALKVHMKGKKHSAILNTSETVCANINDFFPERPIVPPMLSKSQPESATVNASISSYVSGSEVIDAEIKWALKCVTSNYSLNSCSDIGSLFNEMFPDSEIAKRFSCGPTKCAYLVCFGLAPYFKSLLLKSLDNLPFYVLSFDETLNRSLQEKQMDIYIRFWDVNNCLVQTRYLTSVFMGHSTAEIMLKMFHEAIRNLTLKKVLQLSMDGPAVNWKFFSLLQDEMKTDYGSEILNTGSCGLHTVHNAFKHGERASEWEIDNFLISLNYLFKDSPARAEDFIKHSKFQKLPKAFCKHRWLENVPAVERVLLIWEDIKVYIKLVEQKKFPKPTSKSFTVVEAASKDNLMPVKLNFFLSVSKIIQPFLTLYQSDKPLLPFLAEELRKLIVDCLSHFQVMKNELVAGLTSQLQLAKFNFADKQCYSCINKVSAGFVGDRMIKDLNLKKKVTEKDIFLLKAQCQKFIFEMVTKLLEKSPIKYSIVRCMLCLDPRHMVTQSHDSYKKMKIILSVLANCKQINERDCEEILLEFNDFLNNVALKKSSEFIQFNHVDSRVDLFLYKYFSGDQHKKVWDVIKMLLILSHGQADVERGFSLNKSIEVENLSHESYIAQRFILDYLRNFKVDIASLKISKEMRIAASGARQKYVMHLSEKRKTKENEAEEKKRKVFVEDLEVLRSKKVRLTSAISSLQETADKLADEAENTGELKYICQSNSFRKTVKEKKAELEKLELKIEHNLEQLKGNSVSQ